MKTKFLTALLFCVSYFNSSAQFVREIPGKAKGWLALTTTKIKVLQYETFGVSLSFFLASDNHVPIKFHELEKQTPSITESLMIDDCMISQIHINEIKAILRIVNGDTLREYKLFEAAYYPLKTGVLNFPVISLNMEEFKTLITPGGPKMSDQFDIVQFKSKPASIEVIALPDDLQKDVVTHNDQYLMVGHFNLIEEVERKVYYTNQRFGYKLKLKGSGLLHAFEPTIKKTDDFDFDIEQCFTRIQSSSDTINFKKEWEFIVTPRKKGVFNFSDYISFNYIDPDSLSIKCIRPQTSLTVKKGGTPYYPVTSNHFRNIILLDNSISMQLEDYHPNKLDFVKAELIDYVKKNSEAKFDMILFGGVTNLLKRNAQNKLTRDELNQIEIDKVPGSILRTAIWEAIQYLKKSEAPEKNIVLISDGTGTDNLLSTESMAAIAQKYNIKIFTIGIGTEGLVPIGKDDKGRTQMVEMTFDPSLLKEIATSANGKFFHVKKKNDLVQILTELIK